MKKVLNPFFIKGAIPYEYFCDRDAETKLLVNRICNGHNVLLVSPRRIGKTRLIEHCFQEQVIVDKYYSTFVDILQTSSLSEFTYLFGRCLFNNLKSNSDKMLDVFIKTVKSISGDLGYDVQTGLPRFSISLGAIKNPEYTLDEIFECIEKSDKRCLIAIDEFQQIVNYPEKNVEALLRTHIQQCSNADFIFAGSERHILDEMFNSYSRPFYASTSLIGLNELPLDKYSAFVSVHFNEFGKDVDIDVVPRVYNLFAGNTYCMQKTFNVAFNMTAEGTKCTLETAKQAIVDIMQESERSYKGRLSLLSPKPKELLYAIAKDGIAEKLTSGDFVRRHHLSSASSVQSAIMQLQDNDMITFIINDNGSKSYFLTDRFFSLWIKQSFGLDIEL